MGGLRLAVFDCDGTLVDSFAAIDAVMHQAFARHGFSGPDADDVRSVIGLELEAAIKGLLPGTGPEIHENVAVSYREISDERRREGSRKDPLYPGATDAVRQLESRGWLLGVATGKSLHGLRQTLRAHELLDRFVTLHTPDTSPGKPNPDMLIQAMDATGTRREEAVMIGDTTYDMEMAVNAGVAAVGVAWGYHPAGDLRDAGAGEIASSFAELPDLLNRLIGAPA